MLRITAAVLLLLFIQGQAKDIKVQDNFDITKFVGKWYGIIVASNCPMFEAMKDFMTLPTIIYASDGHNVKNSIAYKGPEGCMQMDNDLEVIASGHYKHKSTEGDNEIIIPGTDYVSFATEFRKTTHPGGTCLTLNLNGREMKLPEDLKTNFIKHIHKMGLADKDVLVFNKGEECVPTGI